MNISVRNEYQKLGVDNYYSLNGNNYENPHAQFIQLCIKKVWQKKWKNVIDFACGNGLITKIIKQTFEIEQVQGFDKFLHQRYSVETGEKSYNYSFEDIANFDKTIPTSDVIICSYAIDLVDKNYLSKLLYAFTQSSSYLVLIRPNNHEIEHFGWKLIQKEKFHKSRVTVYKNVNA